MGLEELLPPLNAILNTLSFVALLCGFRAIKIHKKNAHKLWMLTAFACSVLFLVSYITRFLLTGTHKFPELGWLKIVYLSLLTSHTILAILLVPMVLRTLFLAFKDRFVEHKKVARFSFPVWVYVSATGVLIYLALYQLVPRLVSKLPY